MKFRLFVSGMWYPREHATNEQERTMQELVELGFVFNGDICGSESSRPIEMSTLDELVEFVKKHGQVIIGFDGEPSIEIYNSYRE